MTHERIFPDRWLRPPTDPFDLPAKWPYPLRPRKNPMGGKSVTIAAGFRFQGGAIICADSEMTHSQGLKYNQEKIEFIYNDHLSVTAAGAGDDTFIKMAFHRLGQQINNPSKPVTTFQQAEGVLEKIVLEIYNKNIRALPVTQQPAAGFSLLVAISVTGENDLHLLRVNDTAIKPFFAFDSIGTGEFLAKYVAKDLHDPTMPLSRAIILASYVVYSAKNNIPNCGGFTSIVSIEKAQVRFDWDREIAACESYFHSFDSSVKPLFLACADEETKEAEYRQQVEWFVQGLHRMRDQKKKFPDSE
jgi:20S proteasome alpha/beta subunit